MRLAERSLHVDAWPEPNVYQQRPFLMEGTPPTLPGGRAVSKKDAIGYPAFEDTSAQAKWSVRCSAHTPDLRMRSAAD
jgi:hypothetical protein